MYLDIAYVEHMGMGFGRLFVFCVLVFKGSEMRVQELYVYTYFIWFDSANFIDCYFFPVGLIQSNE